MRRAALLLVLLVNAVLVAQQLFHGGPRAPHPAAMSAASVSQTRAERVLTLLDFWAQTVGPNIPMQRARAHALEVGDLITAAGLERRIRQGLLRAESFPQAAAHDPLLRDHDSADVHALRAAAAAWADWASALLRLRAAPEPDQARYLAQLQTRAVDLHQLAYAAVDATLRAVVAAR